MRDFARRTAFATFVCLLFVATLGGLFGGAFAQGISNPRPLTSKAVIDALGYVPARGGVNNDISALDYLSKPLTGAQGGTGVANTGKTITLGGNLTTAGGYGLTITLAGTTSVSFPVSGTLLTSTSDGSGLTGLNADNVSSGTLAVARGGTGVSTATGTGSVVRSDSPTLVTPNIGAASGSSLGLTGSNRILSGLAAPAGGIAGGGYKFGVGENGIYWGSGGPTISALQGSLYLRSNGLPSYNTNGTTGWDELVGLTAVQTLTGKSISGVSNTLTAIGLSSLATQAANTVVANATGSPGFPTAISLPSCSSSSNALTYTLGSGFGCNTIAGAGTVNAGTASQLAYYSASGTAVSGTNALPNGTTATTQAVAVNNTGVATTAYADRIGVQQIVSTHSSSTSSTTSQIPTDNTIPQIGEGAQFMSVTITPKSATSKLILFAAVAGSINTGPASWTAALFRTGTSDALAANGFTQAGSGYFGTVVLRAEVTSGSTSPLTFTVRAGPNTSATFLFNGNASSGTGTYGGVGSMSFLTVQEVGI